MIRRTTAVAPLGGKLLAEVVAVSADVELAMDALERLRDTLVAKAGLFSKLCHWRITLESSLGRSKGR